MLVGVQSTMHHGLGKRNEHETMNGWNASSSWLCPAAAARELASRWQGVHQNDRLWLCQSGRQQAHLHTMWDTRLLGSRDHPEQGIACLCSTAVTRSIQQACQCHCYLSHNVSTVEQGPRHRPVQNCVPAYCQAGVCS